MPPSADPRERMRMQIVSGAMSGAAFLWLALAWLLRSMRGEEAGTLDVLSYVAVALAVFSPVEVVIVERLRRPTGNALADHLATYGLFMGPALFCGIALAIGGNEWPLLAAAIPLGAMILRFPRAGDAPPQ
jgi:hypothetical protein